MNQEVCCHIKVEKADQTKDIQTRTLQKRLSDSDYKSTNKKSNANERNEITNEINY